MAFQADNLLVNVHPTQYSKSLCRRLMRTPFKFINDTMKIDLLPGMVNLYTLYETLSGIVYELFMGE